ncbi:MAG: response regulator, partial [Candidatus Manganitrophaceae bacterium]
ANEESVEGEAPSGFAGRGGDASPRFPARPDWIVNMIKKKILIVEDEISVQESLRSALKEAYSLSTASDGEE